jgi:hypothetical protein
MVYVHVFFLCACVGLLINSVREFEVGYCRYSLLTIREFTHNLSQIARYAVTDLSFRTWDGMARPAPRARVPRLAW